MDNFRFKLNNFTQEELNQITKIHISSFKSGFLVFLGFNFLKLLYSYATRSELSILVIAINKNTNQVAGFILGTTNTSLFYKKFLKQKFLPAFLYIFPKIFSIKILKKITETLIYPQKKELRQMPKSELLVFAVKKDCRGTGLAQKLFIQLGKIFKEKNIKEFKFTTGKNLIGAQKFYEKIGAKKISTIQIHKNELCLLYIYKTNNI